MKRERELEQAVGEIVREGKRRNEKGQPLYPVIYEPAVLAFFGAPEALVEVLMERREYSTSSHLACKLSVGRDPGCWSSPQTRGKFFRENACAWPVTDL